VDRLRFHENFVVPDVAAQDNYIGQHSQVPVVPPFVNGKTLGK
jgi:hypothetical protein